ncbi:hypothetical protein [Aquimarina sediminis]|uniref:hypothetical protein n=1 Tax=Aquimarina sediminis TaxID=2070536 RepID=UPI000CA07153|nr:hypothetical protein [Aquimarina sediminis]
MLGKLTTIIENNPKKIFIFDGLGALFTAFSLGIVLVNLERFFGIPKTTLHTLSILPLLYMVYDLFCYFQVNKHIGFWLRGIAILNLMYCLISIGFALNDSQYIKISGWIYITIEIIVIVAIAVYELKLANKLIKKTF